MPGQTILVVEDEEDIRDILRFNLRQEGYQVLEAGSGEEALKTLLAALPDLVLLDLMLPDMHGTKVCQELRQHPDARNIPVLMLTALGDEQDIVRGLDTGADDYITKPFRVKELLARVRAAFRRQDEDHDAPAETIIIGDLVVNPGRHEVLSGGEPVRLTVTEFRILHCLAKRPGWVFNRYQIVDEVRGEGHAVTDRSVDVQIVALRKKLGACGQYIETVRGVGYRLRDAFSNS